MASSAAVAALDVRMRSGDGLKAAAQLVVAFPSSSCVTKVFDGGAAAPSLLSSGGTSKAQHDEGVRQRLSLEMAALHPLPSSN
nr:unnamed protein product [Digitaria exilis]